MSLFAGTDAVACHLLKLTGRSPEHVRVLGTFLESRLARMPEERVQFDLGMQSEITAYRLHWAWHLGVMVQERPVFVLTGLIAFVAMVVHAAWKAGAMLFSLL